MNQDFLNNIERVLAHEGGYVNDPRDPGGETNFGITRATARQAGYTGKMRDLTRQKAIEIYYKQFWLGNQCDQLPRALAFQYFDACVNHGAKNATRFLQQAAGVKVDGFLGQATLKAIQKQPENELILRFNESRLRFYTQLSTFKTYGKGWTKRVADNLAFAQNDLNKAA